MRRLLCLLLGAALLLGLCGCAREKETAAVTLWYAEDDPLAAALLRAAEEYGRTRASDAPGLALRAFEDYEALQRALNTARPDLLLCPHTLAFSLAGRGLLQTPGGLDASYGEALRGRADCIGSSVFPLGSRVLLLASRDAVPEDFASLCARAAAYGAEQGSPYLAVDSFAELLCRQVLGSGEFHADRARDCFNPAFVEAWNALAEAAFAGGLYAGALPAVSLLRGGLPAAVVYADALVSGVPEGVTLSPVPAEGETLLAELRCLAVTAPEGRPTRGAAAFLRWLTRGERAAKLALSAGLIPALPGGEASDALSALLLSLARRPLWLPDGGSDYCRGRGAFEKEARAVLDLLK